MAIPKVIHYCWFGGNERNELAKKCIASWQKHCPDYQVMEWNESNFDVHCNAYCEHMYQQKKWAFLSDYARLKIVFENGGIYVDTDVELRKPLDEFLKYRAYFGLEENKYFNTGLGFGAEKNNELVKLNMDYYELLIEPIVPVKCPDITTKLFAEKGIVGSEKMVEFNGIAVFPSEYFSPKDYYSEKIHLTENTVSIHHFSRSWCEKETAKQRFLRMHPTVNKIYHIPNKLGALILGKKYETLKSFLKKSGEK